MNRGNILSVLAVALSLLATQVRAAEVVANFNATGNVPVIAESYSAAGNTVALTLSFPPATGAALTVIDNTGPGIINGQFSNLAQGQIVTLQHGMISYKFAANYHGGTGNDLVLQWAGRKTYAWGSNYEGQLGNNGAGSRRVPIPITHSGILAGKSVAAVSVGANHSLALCTDGTLAAWGKNSDGQLGNGGTTLSRTPVSVNMSGVLAGKTVTAIASGGSHNLALCSDGTLAAWGLNSYGQLGNGKTATALTPVAVTQSGALAGKKIIAIAAGSSHSIALCADGTLTTWGGGFQRVLGNGTPGSISAPVAIQTNGVLAGRRVVAIATGESHSLALCADGILAAWGGASLGQLGNGVLDTDGLPVAVDQTGVLLGKTIAAIAAGSSHSLALCTDGTLAAWGHNYFGELGVGSTTTQSLPVDITSSGMLAGRSIQSISAGAGHSFALCHDGNLVAWGNGSLGQTASGSGNQLTPILVDRSFLASGEKISSLSHGSLAQHTIALIDTPVSGNSDLSAIISNPGSLDPIFTPGLTDYRVQVPHTATTFTITPTTSNKDARVKINGALIATGTASPPISRAAGPNPVTLEVTAQNGTTKSYSLRVEDDSALSALGLGSGVLIPPFSPNHKAYTAFIPTATTSVTFSPTLRDRTASVEVNGVAVTSGVTSPPIALALGGNPVAVKVTALDGSTTEYLVSAVRMEPLNAVFTSPHSIPASAASYIAAGNSVNLSLEFAPPTGNHLKVIDNFGNDPIGGPFSNLAQGQSVVLSYNNARYRYVANYFGGNGNDLVLHWAGNKAYAWGDNSAGQLGNGTSNPMSRPTPVTSTGILAGKTILTLAAGSSHSLALCSDGTLATWGSNTHGQLGTGTNTDSWIPVPVVSTGVLAGKTVTAIAAGVDFSIVCCSDGTIAAWGLNNYGQLGNGLTANSNVPSAVVTTGVLAGKTAVSVAAGGYHSVVLTSDGTLTTWGSFALGNDRPDPSKVPVLVSTDGVLSGKRVVAVSAGFYFCSALCSDGTIATWGSNNYGALGDGNETITGTLIPVAVSTAGILSGKRVVKMATGSSHAISLCDDNTLAAWGDNNYGQLGNGITEFGSYTPVPVTTAAVLIGKNITSLSTSGESTFALCSDGTLAGWGYNTTYQLGNGTNVSSPLPTVVSQSLLKSGETITAIAPGAVSAHSLVTVATPLSADSTLSSLILGTGSLNTSFSPAITTYSGRLAHGTSSLTVTPTASEVGALVTINGIPIPSGMATPPITLTPGIRSIVIVVTAPNGNTTNYTVTFTDDSTLSGLSLSAGTLSPNFSAGTTNYTTYVTSSRDSIVITPSLNDGTASVRVNGETVVSGSPANPIPLTVGSNTITVTVTALDGTSTSYLLNVVRNAPINFIYTAPDQVPVSAAQYFASGESAALSLAYDPEPGTNLTVINNTGLEFINGQFTNLTQGKSVNFIVGTKNYEFIVNYYGGTGNDLVLLWANTTTRTWGLNAYGQLGISNFIDSKVPVPVPNYALSAKTITMVAAGIEHNLALCADGSLASWGRNNFGQLGIGITDSRTVPVSVSTTGVLSGKTVISVAAGISHSLALCSDGTIASWGSNSFGQLGDGGTTGSLVPITVNRSGVLAGKTVIAVAAGSNHNLALCSDGTIAAWGYNSNGELGDGSVVSRYLPVLVNNSGVLAGKSVIALAAAGQHNMALCSDGTIATWGAGRSGELGHGVTVSHSSLPVQVSTAGVLAGKRPIAIAAGAFHCLALCADGTLASWGWNSSGQLGAGNIPTQNKPIAVIQSGILSGRSIRAISAGSSHSLALCTDGTLATWGLNNRGQLGNDSLSSSAVPIAASVSSLGSGEKFIQLATGSSGSHSVGVTAGPLSGNSSLSLMTLSSGTLSPAFSSATTQYTASASPGPIRLTPYAGERNARIRVNGIDVASGSPSEAIPFEVVPTTIVVTVTAQNGIGTRTYTVTINNTPPRFSGYAVSTPYQKVATLSFAKILAKATDAEGDTLTLSGIGSFSARGGRLSPQATFLTYTPPTGYSGTDTFQITIRDARGATATGVVTVTVGLRPTLGDSGTNPPILTQLSGGKIGLSFQGIPGRSYQIQRSTGTLTNWSTLATITAGPDGGISYTDPSPPAGSAFYRLYHP